MSITPRRGLAVPSLGKAIVGLVPCVIGLLLTIVNAAWGACLGVTGQHPLVQWLQR